MVTLMSHRRSRWTQISTNRSMFIQTFSCHVYLVEWERQDIRGGVLLPVDVIDLLHLLVVHADDAQVELLDAQYVSQRVHVPAQPGAPKRHHLLEVPQNYSHFKQPTRQDNTATERSRYIGEGYPLTYLLPDGTVIGW